VRVANIPELAVFRATLFASLAKIAPRLPDFRGRTRIFLALFAALGLKGRRVPMDVTLTSPARYRARLDAGSWLQRIAALTGGYEADTVRFLARIHRTGYLLDVGANVGLIAIPFALLTGARVYAFEAVRDNFLAMAENIRLNGLEGSITARDMALGDEQRDVEIQVEGDLMAGEGTGTANIMADGSTWKCVRQPLHVHRLDDLGLEPGCTTIKIDTDGYDLKVLQGAREFVASNRPVIYGEFAAHCMGWHGQTIEDVIGWARDAKYRILYKAPDDTFTRERPPKYSQDILLIPAEVHLPAGSVAEA
jgi:FkbM family methyltransferase